MSCEEYKSVPVCLAVDGGGSIQAVAHYEYGWSRGKKVLIRTRYTDASGSTVYKEDVDFKSATPGECAKAIECVESQDWLVVLDNQLVRSEAPKTFTVTDSTGHDFAFQTANGGWYVISDYITALNAMSQGAGYAWRVRYIEVMQEYNPDYSLHPESRRLYNEMLQDGVITGAVQVSFCPGTPYPVSISWAPDDDLTDINPQLVTRVYATDPVRLSRCISCDGSEQFFDGDMQPVNKPACWFPCGQLPDVPTEPACQQFIDIACDDTNSDEASSWVQNITRITLLCPDGSSSVSYATEADGDLQPYALVGRFVDCATGIVVPDPPTETEYDTALLQTRQVCMMQWDGSAWSQVAVNALVYTSTDLADDTVIKYTSSLGELIALASDLDSPNNGEIRKPNSGEECDVCKVVAL